MSIFFDFLVGPSGRRFRRAVDGDKYDIELFLDHEHTDNLFGPVNVGSLIELSVLSICMINEEKQVVGFMALNDYPNVMGVDPADWETWIRNMFQRYYVSRNTLFIHFMCCKDSVIQYFLNEALVSVFQSDVYLLHVVLLVSSECTQENLARYQVFKKRNMCKYTARREDDSEKRLHYLFTALRQDHCPKLKIRRAVQEDNDDICDILDKKCSRLKELYGDYYISEILGHHPESNRKIIVAEHHERAVGVMCLSPNISYKKLQSIYELRPYYGLRKATPLEKEQLTRGNVLLSTFGEPIMMGKWSPFDRPPNLEEMINSDTSKENLSQLDTASTARGKVKINFKRKPSIKRRNRERTSSSIEQNNVEQMLYNTSDDYSGRVFLRSATVSQTTIVSTNALLEEDPFDYDIVNIDVSLLTLPQTLSTDYQCSSYESSGQSHPHPSETLRTRERNRSVYKHLGARDSESFIYRGEPNAFMIELFGLHENVDERNAFDLLEVAFEIMKDYDYCIIRVPSADTSFPLLQHFCLVPTKSRICCLYSLYVAHRASVLGKLRVREAEFIDIPLIARLFQNMQGKETLWTIENCIIESQRHQAYVFMSGLSIVGIGILEQPEKLSFLRAKFNMDPFHNHKYHQANSGSKIGFSAVDVVLAYPVFETHFRYFAREMMRLSGSSSLVWMTAYRNKWEIFIDIMKDSARIIECKKTDTNANKRKQAEWHKVQKKFEELTGKLRDVAQLKGFWRRTRMVAKKNVFQHKRALNATGGGERPPSPSQEEQKIMEMCPTDFVTEENDHDSDGIFYKNEIIIKKDKLTIGSDCVAGPSKSTDIASLSQQENRILMLDIEEEAQDEETSFYEEIIVENMHNTEVAHKANSLVSAMVPLLPRKSDIDFAAVPELMKLSAIAKNIMAFSTWFLDKKLTSVPIVNVSTKIVVLGASRTAMAFLNTLLFGTSSTYLSFTNITLISTNGLPYMRHYNPAVEMMFPKYHNNTDKYLKSVPYTYYVNIVQGTMVEINKADKFIRLTNGSKYHYDKLFLLFGKQYQHPQYLKPLPERDIKCEDYIRLDIPRSTLESEVINYDTPDNVFIVNNIGQANKALKYVKTCLKEYYNSKILVYGATVHAYCCLAALLEMKVPAENIFFIEPFPPEGPHKTRVSVFYNANVDETVSQVIDSLGIQVYRSYYFQSWRAIDNYVTHVDFLSHFKMITLECSAFFYYGKRGVSTEAFFAVNKAGMAYDAGILIDHEFRTKAPCVYAAGPATAYYRKYYAPTMKHKYFDSYDVGEKLGIQIKDMLDPLFSEKCKPAKRDYDEFSTKSIYYLTSASSTASSSKSSFCFEPSASLEYEFTIDKLPKLLKPKVVYCRLPGGLQYLEVRSPGKKIPHYYLQSLHFSGLVMETFKGGYFKIHMTNDLIVDGITCLTPEKYSVENFKHIYGLSSVCLNNVHLRYTTKKLDDFYEFFRSPWAFFVYHDQADELFAMVKELSPKGQSEGDTIREALRKVCTTPGPSTSNNVQIELRNNFEATAHIESITDYVVEWLSENDVLLPMYLQPSQRTEYDHDTDRNQVFRRKKMSIIGLISKIV